VQPAPNGTDTVFITGAVVVVGAVVVADGTVARVVGTATAAVVPGGRVDATPPDSTSDDAATDELDSTTEPVLGSTALVNGTEDALAVAVPCAP